VDIVEGPVTGSYPLGRLKDFNIGVAFIAMGGASVKNELTDYKFDEVLIKKEVMKRLRKVIFLADYSKFGYVTPIKIGDLNLVNQVITSHGINNCDKLALERSDIIVNII